MIDSLTGTQRKWLAIAILLLVTATLYTLAVLPVWTLNQDYRERIEGLGTRLDFMQRSIADHDKLLQRRAHLQQALLDNPYYFRNPTPALAAADLQVIVQQVADQESLEVFSMQILPADEAAGRTRISLRIRMRGLLENVTAAFHALETGQPALFLDNVSVRKLGIGRHSNVAGHRLDVYFDISGYLANPA